MTEQDIRNRLRWEQMKARLAEGPITMGLDLAAPGSDRTAFTYVRQTPPPKTSWTPLDAIEGEFRVVKP